MTRYDSLDSLRGFASLAVVFGHMLICLPVFYNATSIDKVTNLSAKIFAFSPMHLLWGGHEAVILFFVLSGFVLSLPYLHDRKLLYGQYVIKRFFRIYIPFIVIIFTSIILQKCLYSPTGITGLSKWFNWMWMLPLNPSIFMHLTLMTGEYTHNLNTVAWSLVHEIRISLIFPFIVLLIKRMKFMQSIPLLLLLIISNRYIHHDLPYHLGNTYYYTMFFVIGALVAKYRDSLGSILIKINPMLKGSLIVLALILYNWRWNFGIVITKNHALWKIFNHHLIVDISAAAGATIFFLFAIYSNKARLVLTHRFPLFLGKVSYSLYLIHPIVLLTLLYSLKSLVDPIILITIVPVVSIFLAAVYYHFVEKPSMNIGKVIVSKLKEHKAGSETENMAS